METEVKPGRYFPKPGRGLANKRAAQQAAINPLSAAGNGQSAASDAPAPTLTETQTQTANRIFREKAEQIPDAEMMIRRGENEWEPIYLIVVPELRSEAAHGVYKLRGDLYRKYPKANLNVEVRGRRELGECPISEILIS